jgi:hypothetical protein
MRGTSILYVEHQRTAVNRRKNRITILDVKRSGRDVLRAFDLAEHSQGPLP